MERGLKINRREKEKEIRKGKIATGKLWKIRRK